MSLLPRMILSPGNRVVMCGDSITQQGWYTPLTTMKVLTPPITWINSGVAGNTSGDIDLAVASRITAYDAQALILGVGRNDVNAGTTDGEFTTRYNGILDKTLAAQPNMRILCWNMLCNGEDIPNAFDADIAAKCAIIATAVSRVGGTLVDSRALLLAWETANNPGHAPSGGLTGDGVHPNALGQLTLSQWVYAQIDYVYPLTAASPHYPVYT